MLWKLKIILESFDIEKIFHNEKSLKNLEILTVLLCHISGIAFK